MSRFSDYAPLIAARLMADFPGVTREDAAAIIGNLAHECEGFEDLTEDNPLVPGSRGGYGWAQWTGSRRLQFEAWCARRGWKGPEFEANYSFLFRELQGVEALSLSRTRTVTGLDTKVRIFMDNYLRPGIPHLDARIAWARKALALIPEKNVSRETSPPVVQPEPEPKGWLFKLLKRWGR